MNPCLSLLYVHSGSIGYGRMGTDLAKSIKAMGVDIFDHLPKPDDTISPELQNWYDGHMSGVAKAVCWLSTPTHAEGWYEGQIPSIFTMWEATVLPEQFRQHLDNFESCIVPSMQNVELFSQHHRNVKYVPLGVDTDRWRFTPRKMPTTTFRFLIGGSGARKGGDLARRAFRAAFPADKHYDGPTPMLVVKSPKGEEEYGGPRVEVVSGRLTDEDEVALYESAHCYLQPSRGEGFGLQPLQAMAQGIPTILTNAHGHAGFAGLGLPIGSKMTKAAYFIYGDAGEWWEPDFDELVENMRHVYDNYEAECQRAHVSAEVVAVEWNSRLTAERFLDVMGHENLVPLENPKTWVVPALKRYKTVLNRDWTADMGGTFHIFRKGDVYWETADVKRILFEAGFLDPSCLEPGPGETHDDLGMNPDQVAKIPNYTAAMAHCPTCGQRVNSSPSRADEIFAELEAQAHG